MRTVALATLLALASTTASTAAVTIGPTDDAYVRGGGFDDVTHGSLEAISLKSQGSNNWNRFGLLKFDVSGLSNTIAGALLSLTLRGDAGLATDVEVYVMDDSLGDGWSQTTVTWNNAPAFGATGTAGTTLLGSFAVANGTAAGTTFTFSTPALAGALNAPGSDDLVTLGLVSTNTTSTRVLSFQASEAPSGGPSLSVAVIPLPAAGLLLFGGLGLLAVGRRLHG